MGSNPGLEGGGGGGRVDINPCIGLEQQKCITLAGSGGNW